ncbi:hypothetical protein BS47DRAFT_1373298 [Hydnum rufescens UP504]|uniref:Uncharacterized protein n=1 Tax=Hydnum rufescens UP504 TaxID=1448309 RepID=A0A9P6DTG8_9AGAM|nr:hypothetical protein BS47DRAFT_1373298 [Hydnum rufescens UP504]
MICRHDRVILMVNYYAVALLEVLFRELPTWWRAGVLYDVGCNLHHSTVKWNLMPTISDRIKWGILVFHTFGHQWPCQCIYHPQKQDGFGLSDGEGCERCWGALKKLISICRMSGVSTWFI